MAVSQLPIHWYERRSGAAANKQELVEKNGGQEKDLSAEITMKSAFRILQIIFESWDVRSGRTTSTDLYGRGMVMNPIPGFVYSIT